MLTWEVATGGLRRRIVNITKSCIVIHMAFKVSCQPVVLWVLFYYLHPPSPSFHYYILYYLYSLCQLSWLENACENKQSPPLGLYLIPPLSEGAW